MIVKVDIGCEFKKFIDFSGPSIHSHWLYQTKRSANLAVDPSSTVLLADAKKNRVNSQVLNLSRFLIWFLLRMNEIWRPVQRAATQSYKLHVKDENAAKVVKFSEK